QTGVTSIDVKVDSVDNLETTVAALQRTLGDTADVVSDATSVVDTVSSLDNIRTIALYSLIGALVAGAAIILLSMVMIVRERRREIGVLKAIGSSNLRVISQFGVEALTLTVLAAIIGVVIGSLGATPVTRLLVNNNDDPQSSESTSTTSTGPG